MSTELRRWIERLTAVALALAIGGAAVAAPRPAYGGAAVCRMACAGTARCCCRPAAGGRAAAVHLHGSRPEMRAVVAGGSGCPKDCAVIRVAGSGAPAPPARVLDGVIAPDPAAVLRIPRAIACATARLDKAIRPRAPPAALSAV